MRILVIGSGGREHALCWKLAQSDGVEVYANPGNPGMALVGTCVPGEPLAAAESVKADLTVVGPEAPLVAGVVDQFRREGDAHRGSHGGGGAAGRQQDFRKALSISKEAFRPRSMSRWKTRRRRGWRWGDSASRWC